MTERNDSDLRVGPATYMPGGIVNFLQYNSGETAIEILGDDRLSLYVATASLVPYGAPHPGENCVWLKGWDENAGVPQALADAGIVVLTGRTCSNGAVSADHAVLTEAARVARDRQFAELRRRMPSHPRRCLSSIVSSIRRLLWRLRG